MERDASPPYCNGPIKGSCSLQAVIESSFWIMKWPLNLWGFLSSSWREVQCLLVSARPICSNFMPVIRCVRSDFFPPLWVFGRDWMFINPKSTSLYMKLEVIISPNYFLSLSESSFGVAFFILFERNWLGSDTTFSYSLQLALGDYSSCAPAGPVRFRWRG